MVALEQHQETQRKEREQVFSEQFTEDLKNYKERGVVTSTFVGMAEE